MTRLRIGRSASLAAILFAATLLLATAAAAIAEEPMVLRGLVLLPDGKPAAGAELYWVHSAAISPGMPDEIAFEKRAAADNQGRFELSLERWRNTLSRATPVRSLIACLPGYGVNWLEIARDQVPQEAVLRLVADNPIRGRVIDTEGRPAANAKVAVTTIWAWPSASLDGFLAGKENLQNARMGHPARLLPPLKTVADREGRFELSGVGAERLAWVNISAPGLASDDVEIVNRDGFGAEQYNKTAQAGMRPRGSSRLVGPVFEHVAETELVIRGAVFTGADHKPVVGAPVYSEGHGYPVLPRTDEIGRFELRGLRRRAKARFSVSSPPDANLLGRSIALDLAVGQTVVDTEVELKEGVVIEGRVFDKSTIRGVESEIRFVALPDNHYVDQPGYESSRLSVRTDEEGRFHMLVPPGQAALMAQVSVGGVLEQAKVATPYRQATFSEEDTKNVPIAVQNGLRYFVAKMSYEYLSIVNAARFLNPPPGSGPVMCDLALETGKTIKLAIEDEQGQPVSGAFVLGMSDSLNHTRHIAEASCDIVGLGADRPRRVAILHPERHLAGSSMLTGDESAQVTLRLSATATMTGRVLDAGGEPLADAKVQIQYDRGAVLYDEQWAIKTDGDGKFHEDNVLPGEPFELDFIKGGKFFRVPGITDEKRQLKPREKLDLGEFKTKELQ